MRIDQLVGMMRAAQIDLAANPDDKAKQLEAARLEGLVDTRVAQLSKGATSGHGALTIVREADKPTVRIQCKIPNSGSFDMDVTLEKFASALTGTALVPVAWTRRQKP